MSSAVSYFPHINYFTHLKDLIPCRDSGRRSLFGGSAGRDSVKGRVVRTPSYGRPPFSGPRRPRAEGFGCEGTFLRAPRREVPRRGADGWSRNAGSGAAAMEPITVVTYFPCLRPRPKYLHVPSSPPYSTLLFPRAE